jgi:hypothetical protein
MRATLLAPCLAVLLATPALADTKLSVSDILDEIMSSDFIRKRETFPAIDGGASAAVIIRPHGSVDEAMVRTPPDVNDPIFLELGTNELGDHIPRTPWLPRDLSLGAKRAADAVWDFVLPKL